MMLVHGEVLLVAGSATVELLRLPIQATIQLTAKTPRGSIGTLSYTINPQVGFIITSANPLDTSTVAYAVFV